MVKKLFSAGLVYLSIISSYSAVAAKVERFLLSEPIPGIGSSSSYLVYYGDWTPEKIDEAEKFDLVILHPDTNVIPADIANIKDGVDDITGNDDVLVFGYLSIGEDDVDEPRIGNGEGPGGYASWYMDDADNNDYPDRNGEWGSFYVNAGDPYWQEFIKSATLPGSETAGSDYIIYTLGCDGLFLDTIDTASPWGNYGYTAQGMSSFVQKIESWYPEKYLIANRGLFYFDPAQPAHQWTIRPYIDGDMFECYYTEWDWDNNVGTISPYFTDNKTYWSPIVNTAAQKIDGFTVFCLDYLAINQADYKDMFNTQIDEVISQQGWTDYISSIFLDEIRYDVYNYLHDLPNILVSPIAGTVGTIVTIFGTNFYRNEYIRIDFGSIKRIHATWANNDGSFFTTFIVHFQPPGIKTVTAIGVLGNTPATITFEVIPSGSPPTKIDDLKAINPTTFSVTLEASAWAGDYTDFLREI
ncbi:MAG: hypothetical protein AB1567_08090 [bacterium]